MIHHLCLHAMRQTCVYFELSTNQISPPTPFHPAIMSAPLCKLSGEDLVTWEALLTLKTLGETEEAMVFQLLTGFGKACVVDQTFGAANAVVVKDSKNFLFFITTDREDRNRTRDIKAHLEKYGPAKAYQIGKYLTVQKVQYFTKMTQRRLGWHSAEAATEKDVEDAVAREDKEELLAAMPAAAQLIARNNLDVLPRLFRDLKQKPPALADCVHSFFRPCQFYKQLDPCHRCQSEQAEHLCKKCDTHWCHKCFLTGLGDDKALEDEGEKALQAFHEVTHTHDWVPECVTCDVCKTCEGTKVQGKWTSFSCACGATRCSKHRHVHVWIDAQDAKCTTGCKEAAVKVCACGLAYCWSCCQKEDINAKQMRTFSRGESIVLHMAGYRQWSNENKLEWLIMELGHEANLVDFASKYLELFRDTRTTRQKDGCLELFRKYANIAETKDKGDYTDVRTAQKLAYSKESQIPPRELQEFQALWDEDAPNRCEECNTRIDNAERFCKKHQNSGKVIIPGTCLRIVKDPNFINDPNGPFSSAPDAPVAWPVDSDGYGPDQPHCGGKIEELGNGYWWCSKCGDTEEKTSCTTAASSTDGPLSETLNRHQKSLAQLSRLFSTIEHNDPDHVPQWTKRQRL